ncbi:hypothetical protein [Rhodospirillum sp. A1_3_36]|uniref:hypothetical protein n=1 Tax=Rhodospirillum sp. A1_3_36 TaxID=3391666 RepID=UPI0039A59C57
MNKTNALRYFLLKHLWKNRHLVSPETHREVARSLVIEETETRDWNILWRDGEERRGFVMPRNDVQFYRRGDISNATEADGGDFKDVANAFVATAFRIDDPLQVLAPEGVGRALDVWRTVLWLAVAVALYVLFDLPMAAGVLFAAVMVVEIWAPKGKLVLAGLMLPLSFVMGLPGALFSGLAAPLQFLDTRPDWRRVRTGLHVIGFALGMVVAWRHRETLSLPMIGWAAFPMLGALALALFRWLYATHRHMAPLAIPALVWGLGCTGFFSASLFLVAGLFADVVIAQLVPPSERLGTMVVRSASGRMVVRSGSGRISPSLITGLLGMLAALVAGLTWWSGVGADPGILDRFSPELVEHMQMIDTGDRRLAYKVFLLMLPLAALAAFWLSRRPALLAPSTVLGRVLLILQTPRVAATIVLVVSALVLWGNQQELPEDDLMNIIGLRFGLLYIPTPFHYVLLVIGSVIGLALMVAWPRSQLGPTQSRRLGWAFIWIYLTLALVPGLLSPAHFAAPGAYIFSLFSNHNGIIFGDAVQLAHGMQMHSDVRIMYGMLRAVGLAIWSKYVAPLSVADGAMVLKVGQVILCLSALWLARTMARGRVLVIFLSMALIVPWFHTYHSAILFPNHAGWRFTGYALGFGLAAFTAGWTLWRRAMVLGACGGLFVLLNTETGLCLSLGLLGTLILSAERPTLRNIAGLIASFLIGAGIVVLAFLGLYAATLGPLPSLAAWAIGLGYFFEGASGFAGRPFYFDPFALLIAAHWSLILINAGRLRLERALNVLESLRGGLAITGMLWLAYYVNGTSRQYLPGLVLVYGVFLSTYFAPAILTFLRKGKDWKRFLSLRPVVVAIVVGPMILAGNIQMGGSLWYNLIAPPPTAPTETISGAEVPESVARNLKEKIAFIMAQPDREEMVILSSFGYFIHAETGTASHLPMAEPYMQSYDRGDMDRIMKRIEELAPRRILVDAKTEDFVPYPTEQAFQERFISRILATYRFDHEESGWSIYVRREP